MKLYRTRIPQIASAVIERLSADGDIEVEGSDREEAASDLVAMPGASDARSSASLKPMRSRWLKASTMRLSEAT